MTSVLWASLNPCSPFASGAPLQLSGSYRQGASLSLEAPSWNSSLIGSALRTGYSHRQQHLCLTYFLMLLGPAEMGSGYSEMTVRGKGKCVVYAPSLFSLMSQFQWWGTLAKRFY